MIKGQFHLKIYRPQEGVYPPYRLIKRVIKNNTIDATNTGVKKAIVDHMVSSSGNAPIYLEQDWSSPNGSPSTNNQDGIFFDSSPIQVSQYSGSNDTVIGYGALCNASMVESQPSTNQAKWTARRTWTESSMSGSNYVTDFYLGKTYQADMQNDGTGNFSLPFATAVLGTNDKFQPATNDIIDVTWTITVG